MHLNLNNSPAIVKLMPNELVKLQANKITELSEYFHQSHYDTAVVGLSGGIDSAVAAALAVRALGPKNLIAVRLPCHGQNSDESLRVAAAVAEFLELPVENLLTVEILEAVEASRKSTATIAGGDTVLRLGNMAARERMKVLMDICSAKRALLLGTENKTEHYLAYYTIGGDNISSVEPILNLWKTQVYQLGESLGLPSCVLDRKPTAELWDGQTDEGELGFSYADVDAILAAREILYTSEQIAKKFSLPLKTVLDVLWHVDTRKRKRNSPYVLKE